MNAQQKSLIELIRESDPPTAAEASHLLALAEALGIEEPVRNTLSSYRDARALQENHEAEGKKCKSDGKDLWEGLVEYISSPVADMFNAGGA